MARSCCFSGGLGGRSVSLARGEDASPEILSCQQDLLKGSLEAAGLDLYGETSRVSICALRELELSTKIGQMPQLTGGNWRFEWLNHVSMLRVEFSTHISMFGCPNRKSYESYLISCVLSSCCPCRWRTLAAFGSCQLQGRKVRFMELCCPQALERETQGNGTLCYESTC